MLHIESNEHIIHKTDSNRKVREIKLIIAKTIITKNGDLFDSKLGEKRDYQCIDLDARYNKIIQSFILGM